MASAKSASPAAAQAQTSDTSSAGLHHRTWARPEPRAVVLVVHGMGEHCGRYEHFAAYLVDCGYEVHAMDHTGHGRSGGRRGHVMSFSELTAGVAACVEHLQEEWPGRPLVVLGHSLGGLIAARLLLEAPEAADALILSGPCFRVAVPIPGWKRKVATFLSSRLPWLRHSMPLLLMSPMPPAFSA